MSYAKIQALPASRRNWVRRVFPFLQWMGDVNKSTFRADLIAAITGAVIVLPQGVAFAMIAGLPPQYGLYTAIITPIIAALFGSSRHLVSGPTTAISIVVFSTISNHAEPGSAEFVRLTLTLTFLAGVYQFAFGLARLGGLVNFLSHTVVVGFTAGAAILIATSQMKHTLGITIPRGESFLHTWWDIGLGLPQANLWVVAVAAGTLAVALFVKTYLPKVPYMLAAIVAGVFGCLWLGAAEHSVPLVGAIPSDLPPLSMPDFSVATLRQLAPEALAVAVLGLIEAVSIGRSIATKSGQTIDGNQEFIGQGLSNLAGSFFSSYAGSGSFNRSGINYEAGAKTPLAAILAALILAGVLITVAPLMAYIPIPAMAAIILVVAYNLIDWHHITTILKTSREESILLIVTFGATLLLDLEFAIYAGVLLSLMMFLNKAAHPRVHSLAPNPDATPKRFMPVAPLSSLRCLQLEVLELNGPIFFGSVNTLEERLAAIHEHDKGCRHVLLVADGVNVLDITGAEFLAQEAQKWRDRDGGLYICGLNLDDKAFLKRGGYMKAIGKRNLFASKKTAIPGIMCQLNPAQCQFCSRKVFDECKNF